jgi:dTDP-L-rhamnose 4-epimerase
VVAGALKGVDCVVHLAAAVGVGQSMYEPAAYVRANALGSAVVLGEVLRRQGVGKLVVASSMSLYGEGATRCRSCGSGEARPREAGQLKARRWETLCARCGAEMEPLPTPETKPAELASIYAATKKHQEDLFLCFGRAYGIPTYALRLFNVFGPRQSLLNPYTGVVAIFLSRLLAGQPPLIFEDGRQRRDLVDVRDVAEALLLAIERPDPGVWTLNIGTGRALSVADVARALAAQLGADVPPVILGEYRAGDVRHCFADTRLAREVLGFTATRTFEQGLPGLIEWCRQAAVLDRSEAALGELRARGLVT